MLRPLWILLMISPVQSRMARAALKLTPRQVDELSGVSYAAIFRFEAGKNVNAQTIDTLTKWYETQGVYFIGDSTVSFGKKKLDPESKEFADGLRAFEEFREELRSTFNLLQATADKLDKPKK